ncbi:MAG: hypothetical protein ACI9WC_001485 [Arenicella sp.]|jgi:hypothetical protein
MDILNNDFISSAFQKAQAAFKTIIVILLIVSFQFSHTVSAQKLLKPIDPNPPLINSVMATEQYCTGFDHNDMASTLNSFPNTGEISTPKRRWAQHPIIWKHLIRPQLSFYPHSIIDPNIGIIMWSGLDPSLTLNDGVAQNLNVFEGAGSFKDSAGVVVDPSGSWNQFVIDDSQTTAIFAAMAIWSWGTPVYLNFPVLSAPFLDSRVAIINCVTLSHPDNRPDLACDWDLTSDPTQVQSCPGLVVESLDVSYFTSPSLCTGCDSSNQQFIHAGNISATVFDQSFNNLNSISADTVHRILIDPPVEVDQFGVTTDVTQQINTMLQISRRNAAEVMFRADSGTVSEPKAKLSLTMPTAY